jgi:transcriptional regulator with XRE-family HTH domain
MKDKNLTLLSPDELPQTDQPKKKRDEVNCLSDILRELMDARNVEMSHIHKATGIPYATLSDWLTGKVGAQLADKNLLMLARFFNVHLHYLVYGVGDDSPAFGKFESNDLREE